MKTCNKCGVEKPLDEYHTPKTRPNGMGTCKQCINSAALARYHADPDRARNNQLKRKFGITAKQYDAMYQEQAGRCGICAVHQSELTKRLAVDHNHATGKVRGLLCDDCNIGLGKLKDSPSILRKALNYLEDNGHYG